MTNGALWITNRIMNKVYICAFALFPNPLSRPFFFRPHGRYGTCCLVIGFHYACTWFARSHGNGEKGVMEGAQWKKEMRRRGVEAFVESLSDVLPAPVDQSARESATFRGIIVRNFSPLCFGAVSHLGCSLSFRPPSPVSRKPRVVVRGKRLT